MPLIVEATEGKAQLSVGTHELRCTNIEEDVLESGRDPNVWRFFFECEDELDPNGNPIEIDGIASRYLTPNSKAWAWCEALGMKLEVGKRCNLEEAIGGRALGKVISKASSTGAKYARLDSLMPFPKGSQRAQEPADAADDLGEWWKLTRANGFERDAVLARSQSMFENREPKDLTAPERAKLMEALG